MDNLDFGLGFGVFMILMTCVLVFLKGIITFFIYYLPSNWFYEEYFKGEDPSNNFFKAFFCWVITISFLHVFIFRIFMRLENLTGGNNLLVFFRGFNNGMCFQNLIFYYFVFWSYSYDSNAKKIKVVEEFNLKKKFFNYLGLFSLLFIAGFIFNFGSWNSFHIDKFVFLGILIVFLRFKNVTFTTDKT